MTLAEALDEAIKWAIPALGTAFLALVTVKHRAIMNWRRTREARNSALDALLSTWPSVVKQIGDTTESNVRITREFAAVHEALGDLLALNYGHFEHNATAMFVRDNSGRNLMVNSSYARLLHTGRDELMDYGYRRFIKPSEAAGFLGRFKVAAEEHREFECDVCLVKSNGDEIKVHVRMVPHPRQHGPATHWIGTVVPVEGQCDG